MIGYRLTRCLPAALASLAIWHSTGQVHAAEAPAYLVDRQSPYEAPGRGAGGTVRARPRPDFDPIGVSVGSFRLVPKLAVGTAYDSNVFRSENNVRGDLIGRVQPSFKLESDWSRHSLAVSAAADLGFYAEENGENYTDAQAAAAGIVDIRRGLRLETGLSFGRLHEARGSVDGDGGTEPTTFNRFTAQSALAARTGRVRYRFGGGYTTEDYQDVPRIGGGTLNQDDRDQAIWSAFGLVSYEALPDTRAFVAGQYKLLDFRASRDDSGVNRDSRQQSVVGGFDIDLGGITFARAYAGWLGQQFDDDRLEDISGFTVGGDVTSNITPLTTITATLNRNLHSTVTAGASAFVETGARAEVDHELLRNVLLGASVWSRRLTFKGIDRTDDHVGFGFSGEWLLNRYARVRLEYDFDLRNSGGNAAVNDWRRHVAALRLLLQR